MPGAGGQQNQQRGRRKRQSGPYGIQLAEKQNLKKIYGVREEQLKKYYKEAKRSDVETGPKLIKILEGRLDNSIYRAGIADTRPQARQMASHKIFLVNGRVTNIPSYRLKKGDMVQVKASKQKQSLFANFEKKMQNAQIPDWLEVDTKEFGFRVTGEPDEKEVGIGVEIQAVVELLAR